MKYSGIEWIGDMPDTWELVKIGSLFLCRNEKVNDTDYPPLSVSRGGVVPQMENVAKSDANDNRKLVLAGDFAINSRSDRKQSCGLSELDGSVSLINTVLYLRNKDKVYGKYLNYLLKNYGFAEEFYRWGHGIVADLWTTRWQEMKNIVLPLPIQKHQIALTNEIEKKLEEIDRLIEIETQQIEKLKEYKQAVITEVVTKGLDKSAPMKDSGVDWIGEIPFDSDVVTFSSLIDNIQNGYVGPTRDLFVENGVPYIQSLHIKDGKIVFEKHEYYVREEWANKKPKIFLNNLLIVQTGDIGQVALVDEKNNGNNCHALLIVKLKESVINPNYLCYYFRSKTGKELLLSTKTGALLPHLNAGRVGMTYVVVPPLSKQNDIVVELNKKCKGIDMIIEIKQQKIEKLNEYKKSLIYEYVTGKKEVK